MSFLLSRTVSTSIHQSNPASSSGLRLDLRKDHSLVAMCRLLTAMASLVVEYRLQGMQTSAVAAHGISSCSAQALEQGFSNCSTRA